MALVAMAGMGTVVDMDTVVMVVVMVAMVVTVVATLPWVLARDYLVVCWLLMCWTEDLVADLASFNTRRKGEQGWTVRTRRRRWGRCGFMPRLTGCSRRSVCE